MEASILIISFGRQWGKRPGLQFSVVDHRAFWAFRLIVKICMASNKHQGRLAVPIAPRRLHMYVDC